MSDEKPLPAGSPERTAAALVALLSKAGWCLACGAIWHADDLCLAGCEFEAARREFGPRCTCGELPESPAYDKCPACWRKENA